MNLSILIKNYFAAADENLTIDVLLRTNKEIDPAEVVANRTDVAAQYNETFLNKNDLEDLW